jgi:Tol biopolymer transport system component
MLTGKLAFDGSSAASVIAAILEREAPSVTEVAPLALDRVLRRCLAKDPDQRWQSARDLKMAMELASASEPQATLRAGRLLYLPWIIAATSCIATALALWALWHQPATEERQLQFAIGPPSGAEFVLGAGGGSTVSPDGRTVAFVAISNGGTPKLWIRSLDSTVARDLPGTEGAQFPFWSPDARYLGFFASGKLQRVDLSGGPAVVLAEAPNGRGGTWNSQGIIVFGLSASTGLFQVSATGGSATSLTTLDSARGENTHRWPQFLPDGRRLLYFVRGENPHITGIYLGSLDRPQEKSQLLESPNAGAYLPPRGKQGYLLWVRQQTLIAQPFDPGQARLSGDPVPVSGAEGVALVPGFGRAHLSVSNNGTILFGKGSDRYKLTWFNRESKVLSTVGQPERYASLRISSNDRQVAVVLADSSGNPDIWLMEFSRGIPSRLTFGPSYGTPIWSPDGQRIAYHLLNQTRLLEKSASGAGQEETVLQSQSTVYINDWSADGRYLVYTQAGPEGRTELWLLPQSGDRKPVPFSRTQFNVLQGQVSPDSKWIAYTSDESGRNEIYVQSFPTGGGRWLVSNNGGSLAHWRRDGKELFYRAPDGKLMVVPVRQAAQGLEFGTPAALFRISEPQGMFSYPYDLSADGQRILALVPGQLAQDTASLNVIVNWDAKAKP